VDKFMTTYGFVRCAAHRLHQAQLRRDLHLLISHSCSVSALAPCMHACTAHPSNSSLQGIQACRLAQLQEPCLGALLHLHKNLLILSFEFCQNQ
jgi:hypothetical protein